MQELIDRHALKNHLYRAQAEAFKRSEWYVAGSIQLFIDILDKQPTIEAEPVWHDRWILVEDALPEIGYSVLVTRQTESNTRYIRTASRQDDCWMDDTDKYGSPNPHQVITWMPMPDAYEPPKERCHDKR